MLYRNYWKNRFGIFAFLLSIVIFFSNGFTQELKEGRYEFHKVENMGSYTKVFILDNQTGKLFVLCINDKSEMKLAPVFYSCGISKLQFCPDSTCFDVNKK